MKYGLLALALTAAVGLSALDHPAVDIGTLRPVELVRLTGTEQGVRIETDTGETGEGGSLTEAVEMLQQGAKSKVFLNTADKLILTGKMEGFLEEVDRVFRPSCRVCVAEGPLELEAAAEYLDTHPPQRTLAELRMGETAGERLILTEGRGRLVPEGE